MVPNTDISSVAASVPVAQVSVSKFTPAASTSPPYPVQRATGKRNSSPASSASRDAVTLFSHVGCQYSGALVWVSPPEQFCENKPSLNRFGP